jgi:hypothetical protein
MPCGAFIACFNNTKFVTPGGLPVNLGRAPALVLISEWSSRSYKHLKKEEKELIKALIWAEAF